MPAKIGYSVATITDLKNISSDTRTTGYIRSVTSERAWFIFIESATDTADNINVIAPTTGTGRWFKLFALVLPENIPGLVEYIQDAVANSYLLSNILDVTYSDGSNTLTLNIKPSIITNTHISDTAAIAQSKISNLTTDLSGKANSVHTHIADDIVDLYEAIEDRLGTFLVSGDNVSIVYNDSLNQLVISSTGGGGGVGSFEWDTVDLETWDATY